MTAALLIFWNYHGSPITSFLIFLLILMPITWTLPRMIVFLATRKDRHKIRKLLSVCSLYDAPFVSLSIAWILNISQCWVFLLCLQTWRSSPWNKNSFTTSCHLFNVLSCLFFLLSHFLQRRFQNCLHFFTTHSQFYFLKSFS